MSDMTNAHRTTTFTTVDDVLAAAAAPASPQELGGEAGAVAAFRAAGPAPARRRRGILAGKTAVAAVGALGLLTAGGAAAATGSLPDAAQDAAHEALTKVGVDVPRGKGKGLATAPGQVKQDKGPAEGKGPKADPAQVAPPEAAGAGSGGATWAG
ncbi:MAG TPA: hypothetical protein VM263_08970, partial [Acidimicrobiales bacterium]|nr:hypothetical protein [Acidimicrobiales bacterium]